MQPESKKLLTDMHEAAVAIQQFANGKTLSDLQRDDLLRSGIYFKFVIIGEALSQLRQREPDVADKISESPRIIGFRNQVTHGYGQLDDEITWRIVELKLPILIKELEELLRL